MLRELQEASDLDELLRASESHPVMLLKHSTRCPASSWAREEFEAYARAATTRGVECAMVLVVESRPLSQEIAARLGVRHQSPQAILLSGREAVWSDSHEGVTAEALERAEGAAS